MEETMAEQRETYRGRTIVVKTVGGKPQVSIDNKAVEVLQEGPDKYVSDFLPYTSYPTLLELAKQVVDCVPDFKATAGN